MIHFHIHYQAVIGQQLAIEYKTNNKDIPSIILCQTYDGENWTASLETKEKSTLFYNYIVLHNGVSILKEWGQPRFIGTMYPNNIYIEDKWRARANEGNAFLSTAFTKSIFKRKVLKGNFKENRKEKHNKNQIIFRLHAGAIPPHLSVGICGNTEVFGKWTTPILMQDNNFPTWEIEGSNESTNFYLEYKYVIFDPKTGNIIVWEEGQNRHCHFVFPEATGVCLVVTDENFRFSGNKWRGTGVAIPVFSLRSRQGLGIGEFQDLKPLIDWSKFIGLNMIQILPINDTIANKTWTDSYPYAAISVFALHPLYVNLQTIAPFKNKADRTALQKLTTELNGHENVDFDKVLQIKFLYLKKLFNQEYDNFNNDSDARIFINENNNWLRSYATFCHLRDLYNTSNFNAWPKYKVFSEEIIDLLCCENYVGYKDIQFYYFLQYHADKQLLDVKYHARENGIALKGDLPIGIYRFSSDAWVSPALFNMNEQAGAPPDDYAVLGQNWGFPTYNWSVMAKDDFKWWRNRMQHLSRHFDALRIDHILGFFRIWQIPTNQVTGTMGSFNPRIPLSIDDLNKYGIHGDLSRYTKPYISHEVLKTLFGSELEDVLNMFFNSSEDGTIIFKSSFDTQQEITQFISQNQGFKKHEPALLSLISEVLLMCEPDSNGQLFNPRITIDTTKSYHQLNDSAKSSIDALYNDYYYKRHDEYWKEQALWKLPAILDASDMLICGEDLGMIPKAVPGVMKEMNIISLEIQRMPKGNSKYGQVAAYPYFSVCSPSCHDMSTIRGWWQSDHENAKDYYYNYLHWYGLTPLECTPEIVQAIIEDHLMSPSILAIFPIQDLIGMDKLIRRKDVFSEQINEPSNPKHYWKYRFHLNVEDLIAQTDLNKKIISLISKSGR